MTAEADSETHSMQSPQAALPGRKRGKYIVNPHRNRRGACNEAAPGEEDSGYGWID